MHRHDRSRSSLSPPASPALPAASPPCATPRGCEAGHLTYSRRSTMTLNSEIFGLPIPDAGPIFPTALVIHVLSGLTAVIAGALAATARKRPGRHPRAGRIYLWALGGVFATALLMAIIRSHEDAHLFAIAVIAFGLGLYGYRARRRHRPGWPPHHAIGMGGSYIALLTGFYVDNGPFLPLWDRLPHITYWLLPTLSASRSSGLRYDASRTGQPRIPIRSHMGTDHPMIAV